MERTFSSLVSLLALSLLGGTCGGQEEGTLVLAPEARSAGAVVVDVGDEAEEGGVTTAQGRALPYAVRGRATIRVGDRLTTIDVAPGELVRVEGADLRTERPERAGGEALEVDGDEPAVRALAVAIDAKVVTLGPGAFRLEGEGAPDLIERAAYVDTIAGIRDVRTVAPRRILRLETLELAATRPAARPRAAPTARPSARIAAPVARVGGWLPLRVDGVADGTPVVLRVVDADGRRKTDLLRVETRAHGGGVTLDRPLAIPPALAPERVRVIAELGGTHVASAPVAVRRRFAQYYSTCGVRMPATDKGFQVRFADGSAAHGYTDHLGIAAIEDAPAGEYEILFEGGVPLPRPYEVDSTRPETFARVASALRSKELETLLYGLHDASEIARPEWADDVVSLLAHPHTGVWISAALALGSYDPALLDRAAQGFPLPQRWPHVMHAAGRTPVAALARVGWLER